MPDGITVDDPATAVPFTNMLIPWFAPAPRLTIPTDAHSRYHPEFGAVKIPFDVLKPDPCSDPNSVLKTTVVPLCCVPLRYAMKAGCAVLVSSEERDKIPVTVKVPDGPCIDPTVAAPETASEEDALKAPFTPNVPVMVTAPVNVGAAIGAALALTWETM